MTGQTNGNNILQRKSDINIAHLKQDTYFESLLQAAHHVGTIGDDEIKRIQLECLYLLAEKTKKHTSGSASFLIDDAESIMKSNLYTIGLHLKSFSDPHSAIKAVMDIPISELYTLGLKRITTKLNAARHLYHKILETRLNIDHEYYAVTLVKYVKQFFDSYKDYHVWYNAHELPGDIIFSYPICYPGYIGAQQELFAASNVDDFVGIEYVQRYLQAIYYENIFCKCFTDETIHRVLLNYHRDYNSIPFNIFEKVLVSAIRYALPENDFTNKSSDEIELMLANAYYKLAGEIGLKNMQVQEYMKKALLSISTQRR